MSYPITAIEEIDADEADALKAAGIRTTEKLLEAAKSPKGRQAVGCAGPIWTRSGCCAGPISPTSCASRAWARNMPGFCARSASTP